MARSNGGPERAAPAGPASDEQAELERLRAEVGRLRAEVTQARAAQPPAAGQAGPGRRPRRGWRGPVSALLIVAGCVLAPLSVLAVWSANQVSDTSKYVANVAPLIHQPAIQGALTDKITTQVTDRLHVQALANQAAGQLTARGLPRIGTLLHSFSGSIASGVDGFVHSSVAKIVASPQAARIWAQANTTAHTQVVKVLSGQAGGAVGVSNGNVTVDLAPFINDAKRDLSGRGLTVVNKLPAIHPTFTLFSAKYLVKAQSAYRLITTLKVVAPLLALILIALGCYLAGRHRRAVIGAGFGVAGSMLVLGAGLVIARAIYLNSVPSATLPAPAAAALFDTLIRYVKDGLRLLLVLGLLVAAGGFFAGPSVTAVRIRAALVSSLGVVRSAGERAGLSTGRAGTWAYDNAALLRVAAVILVALILVFAIQPTALAALLLAVVLLVLLGLIELLGRPPGQRVPPGQPG